jgi:hypothetical protein
VREFKPIECEGVCDLTNPRVPDGGRFVRSGNTRTAAIVVSFFFTAVLGAGYVGAECIDYRDYLHLVGGVDTPGRAYDVAVSGVYAYVADRQSGLQVIDITDPQSPQIVGSADTEWWAFSVAVADTHVYVAAVTEGLQIRPPQCPSPTPVPSITDLQARPTKRGIALTWHGEFDPELLDSFVYRQAADGPWFCLTDEPHAGGPDFEFMDVDVERGVPYGFEVELLASGGDQRLFGPVFCQFLPALELDLQSVLTWGKVQLHITLPHPTQVGVSLYDPTGRRLALQDQGLMEAGRHRLDLNVMDMLGVQAATGISYVTLETARGRVSRAIALVR